MGPVKVLVTHRLAGELVRRISSVDSRLKVIYAAEELTAELRREGAGETPAPGPLDALLAEAEVMITMMVPRRLLERAPRLKWLQVTSAGIDHLQGTGLLESKLISALKEGWIAGAGLDVFATEPLPPGSGLWGLPHVILTPHITSGKAEVSNVRLTELICENLRCYLAGQELLNLVDKEAAY